MSRCGAALQLEIEEKAAEKSAVEAYSLRDQCDADLEASMPPLRRALKELQNINKGDIAELKSLKNPPVSVKVVMKAVCHMLGAIPQGIQDRRNLEPEVEDALWWRESMKLLGQINFMEILLTFDKNSIPESVIKQVSTGCTPLDTFSASASLVVSDVFCPSLLNCILCDCRRLTTSHRSPSSMPSRLPRCPRQPRACVAGFLP